MAIFMACAAFSIPCEPLVCPIDLTNYEGDKWARYIELLEENGKLKSGNRVRTFFDGETNIRMIFGRELSEKNFARYIAAEQERIESLEGTETQRERWGVADKYTSEEYDDLDRMYDNRIAQYKGITVTDQMDYIITEACKWQLVADKRRRMGDIKAATDALKAVDQLLASESLRKKDEKPVESLKTDALVVALEKAGLMENGQLLKYDELIEVMRDRFVKSKKYNYSLDAADQMIADYYNNLRANADMGMLVVLPEDLQVEDEYGEFEPEETEEEKKRKRYAGLAPVQFGKE